MQEYIDKLIAYADTLPEPDRAIILAVADIAQNDSRPYEGIIAKCVARCAVTRKDVARVLKNLRKSIRPQK